MNPFAQFAYTSAPMNKRKPEEGDANEAAKRVAPEPPPEPKLTPDQAAALTLARSNHNLCIIGKSGVGKTFTLKRIRQELEKANKTVAVVAAYSSAAHNAEGMTVHSFLKPLPRRKVWRTRAEFEEFKAEIVSGGKKSFKKPSENWFVQAHRAREAAMRKLNVLILDELSLFTPELFQVMDATLRAVRKDNRRFGGVQVIAVGDPAQLPPVPIKGEEIKYVFEDDVWKTTHFKHAVLKTVMRQNDELFIRILDAIREGQRRPFSTWDPELRDALLSRLAPAARVTDDQGNDFPVVKLRATNAQVDANNMERLTELPGDLRTYPIVAKYTRGTASTQGTPEEVLAILEGSAKDALQEELDNANRRPAALKESATAILTYNMDTAQGLYNGSVGVVERLQDDSATVRFRHGSVVVSRITTERELSDGSVVTLEFLPLRAAYSCTIDKSQGITLDAADVHLTANMKDGAAYTALSRVRSLDSLIIRTDPGWSPDALFESAFRTSEAVLDFLKKVGV